MRRWVGDRPDIRFYNDHELKGAYLGEESIDAIVERDFEEVRGKKVYFVDETFSQGKGAGALLTAAIQADIDATYFALTKDPEPPSEYQVSEAIDEFLKKEISEGRVIVYENPIKNLFSRFGSRLYAQDFQGETLPLHIKPKEPVKRGGIPNADNYMSPPENMTMEEYSAAVSARSNAVVREMKEIVYKALKEG